MKCASSGAAAQICIFYHRGNWLIYLSLNICYGCFQLSPLYGHATLGQKCKTDVFPSRTDLKKKKFMEYFCFPVAALQVKFPIPSQARPLNCRRECLSCVRRRAYAAPTGTLADAFRFPVVCRVYGLAQTCRQLEAPTVSPFHLLQTAAPGNGLL